MPENCVAEVLLDQQLGLALDYAVPEALRSEIQVGVRVEVPFRKSLKRGTVSLLKSSSNRALRPITSLLEKDSLPDPLWRLAHWISDYYCSSLQKTLKSMTPPSVRKGVKSKTKETHALEEADFFPTQPKSLNSEQRECLEKISKNLLEGTFAVHLIHGITGSGKTEIYLQAIQQAIDLGKSALLLVPEIALTSQTIEIFRARFGLKLAVLHHRRSLGERTSSWAALKSGEVKIAIGARSAIFAPALHLGLIIIDEEHDSSYKQSEEMPTYHARDVAVMRAKLEGATILLGSATPSFESFYNQETGKYFLSTLSSRATSASLPQVQIVDMKRAFERNGGFTHFSEDLLEALREKTKKGEQSLLLLNRRGYHRMQRCKECHHVVKCPHCDLSLTYHRLIHSLCCHLCDFRSSLLRECPSCKAPATLEFRGFGTEHVERSLHAVFPEIRTLRMDRDTTKGKDSHDTLFKEFRSHKADVLIGTQMIAKGFHFPSVTLVGILNADATLQIPDFRSSERLFQLITQVAGRAGRAELPGEVILQTFLPHHPLIRLAADQDYLSFYAKELEERKLFSFPPFCRLVKIVFSGKDEEETRERGYAFRKALLAKAPQGTELLPLLPCAKVKVKDLYRFQFLIKAQTLKQLAEEMKAVHLLFPKTAILIDIDPVSIFF